VAPAAAHAAAAGERDACCDNHRTIAVVGSEPRHCDQGNGSAATAHDAAPFV
jgi:hypothetical protein